MLKRTTMPFRGIRFDYDEVRWFNLLFIIVI